MHPIKFRIWLDGRFHYWGFIDRAFIGLPSSNTEPLTLEELERRSQQFTGLHDKNGVEVYEGDIIKRYDNEWIAKVIYLNTENHSSFQLEYFHLPTESRGLTGYFQVDVLEVIGNIHENKERREG